MDDKNLPATTQMTMPQVMQLALEQKADVATLEKMMELQERYEAKEAKKAYVVGMNSFRAECPTIIKTKEGHNNKYAGLAETVNQIKALLAKCGLSHSWKVGNEDKQISVTCCVTHVGGHQECTTISAPPETSGSKNAIQAIASTVSYLERYTLYAILGLASSEMDDDGQGSESEYITEDQIETINKGLERKDVDLNMFLTYMESETLDKILAKDMKKAEYAISNAKGAKK